MPALLTSTSIDLKRDSAVSTILAAVAGSPMWPSTRATWLEAATSVDWVTFRELATTLKPRSTNPFTIPAPIPCEAPVTMAVFRGLLMVVYLDKRFDLVPLGIDERATEHSNQPFGGSRVRENRIAQRGIRKPTQHRDLNGGHHLARLGTEYREAENPILGPDQGLGESARLGQGAGAQH